MTGEKDSEENSIKIPISDGSEEQNQDEDTFSAEDATPTEEEVESGDIKIPIAFHRLVMGFEGVPTGKAKKIPIKPSRKRPKKGQKKVEFSIELNDKVDPMMIFIEIPDLENFKDEINLHVTEDQFNIWVENKDYFGFEDLELPSKVFPQFTVGYYETNILKLYLKKQLSNKETNQENPPSMIWCSENVLMELDKAKKIAKEFQERYHKAQLDYQDYLVNSKREKDEYMERFSSEFILNVLDVQDNFERALEAAKKAKGKKNLMTGVEMIRKQLESMLKCNGVSEIEAMGLVMDPLKHEVLTTEENSEVPENTVIEVVQKGYMYQNKVLRLAKVKVAKPINDDKK
ncbi:MAG: nucleotide exchange factor GrpE [Thermoplasmata archaeon]|nr:MAG: nucleotide exchange factor GrpE [Thermoplasmata archaeon]